jgi:hypothetical protein
MLAHGVYSYFLKGREKWGMGRKRDEGESRLHKKV